MNPILEVCAGSLTSALNAQAGGAHRIELCDNLDEGGTTPSPGVIIQAVRLLTIPVFVLIRPRPGDFIYSDAEFGAMKEDILFCKTHGAKGVVLGILKADGSVDTERTGELVELARPMKVTFHRAFDLTAEPFQALEDIISLGIERILTSGQASNAIDGADLIKQLNNRSNNRIIIMPGSGITEKNVTELIRITGAMEIHGSLRSLVEGRMETDIEKVRALLSLSSKF
jgi:copper homeostasis protein